MDMWRQSNGFNPLARSKFMLETAIHPSLTRDSEASKGMQDVQSIHQFFEDTWRNFQRYETENNHNILTYTFFRINWLESI